MLVWAVSAAAAIEILEKEMPWLALEQKLALALAPVNNTLFVVDRLRNKFSNRR